MRYLIAIAGVLMVLGCLFIIQQIRDPWQGCTVTSTVPLDDGRSIGYLIECPPTARPPLPQTPAE